MKQQLLIAGRVGAPGQHEMPPVGGRQVDIHQLHGGELVQDGARRQSRRAPPRQVLQGHVQAVGDKGDEDMRLDPLLVLVEHRSDGEIVLEFLERLLDLGEPRVVAPQRRRVLAESAICSSQAAVVRRRLIARAKQQGLVDPVQSRSTARESTAARAC